MDSFTIQITEQDQILIAEPEKLKIGSQYDNEAQSIIFIRPTGRETDELIIYFSALSVPISPINIGIENELVFTESITKYQKLQMQIAFIKNHTELKRSSKIEIEFRPSIKTSLKSIPSVSDTTNQLKTKAFTGVDISDGILSFVNLSGAMIDSVALPIPIGGISELTTETPVTGIPNGKLLGVADGKVTAFDSTTTTELNEQFFMIPDIHIAVGETQEIYYSSILHCINLSNYNITIVNTQNAALKDNFKPLGQKLQIIATQSVVGTHALQIIITDKYGVIAYQSPFNVHIVAKADIIPAKTKFMCIGDSTVDIKVLQAFEARVNAIYGVANIIEFVGTHGTSPYNHQGHPGWSAKNFTGDMGAGANPFWNDTTKKLDFNNYTTTTGIKPDIVYYKIGTNDAYYDYTSESFAENVKKFIDQMRLDWGETLPIYLSLAPMFGTADAMGNTYGIYPGRDKGRLDRSIKNNATKLYEVFASYEKLYFVPNLFCFDSAWNYQVSTTTPVNPFSTLTEHRMTEGVQPNAAGYVQEASNIFSRWLDAHKSEPVLIPTPSIILTNLAKNSGMTSLDGWGQLSPNGVVRKLGVDIGSIEILTQTAGTVATNVGFTWLSGINLPDEIFLGHIYYIRNMVKANTLPVGAIQSSTGVFFYPFGNAATIMQSPIPLDSYSLFSAVITNTKTGAPATTQTMFRMGHTLDITNMNIIIKEPILIDLTKCFGPGKEPTKAWCDTNINFFVGNMEINA